jgi:tetratricopeptide (TPR) repeat protein
MSNSHIDADRLRADRQELNFLEKIQGRLPEDAEVLRALADLYTSTGKVEEGLRIDERLSQLCADDPLVWYNLGCSLSLSGRLDDALEALSKALEMGYDDYEWMKKDGDLSALRGDARFESMLEWIYNSFEQTSDG